MNAPRIDLPPAERPTVQPPAEACCPACRRILLCEDCPCADRVGRALALHQELLDVIAAMTAAERVEFHHGAAQQARAAMDAARRG